MDTNTDTHRISHVDAFSYGYNCAQRSTNRYRGGCFADRNPVSRNIYGCGCYPNAAFQPDTDSKYYSCTDSCFDTGIDGRCADG
jgi:hypothetical protein